MYKKDIKPLAPSFIEAFGNKITQFNPPKDNSRSAIDEMQQEINVLSRKIQSARMGGVGAVGRLTEQRQMIQVKLNEAMGNMKNRDADNKSAWAAADEIGDEPETALIKKDTSRPNDNTDGDVEPDTSSLEKVKSVKEATAPKTDKEDDGEGMDPVGAGDSDIDNDGDSDQSDEYLKKRRKAISKSMKKQGE